jgi:hypothetical protein
MKFVLVNERTPRGASTCAHCGATIVVGYLRDLSSQVPYCDQACFVGRNIKTTPPILRLSSGIDGLPFRSLLG